MQFRPAPAPVLALCAAHAAITLVMLPSERAMRGTGGPGIVGLELAGTPQRASEILQQWGTQGQAAARSSLRWDYLYMTTYAGLGVWLVRAVNQGRLTLPTAVARSAEALPVLAMLADVVEGRELMRVLDADLGRAPAARRAALAKFASLIAAAGYAGALGCWHVWQAASARTHARRVVGSPRRDVD